MGSLLFDGSGQSWDSESPQLREAIGGVHAGDAFVEFVLKNLGYVELRGIRADGVELRMRPARADQRALAAAWQWLSDRTFRRVVLSVFEGQWRNRVLQSIPQLIDASARAAVTAQDRLAKHRHRRRIAVADLTPAHPLRGLIARWQELDRIWDRERFDAVIQSALGDRYVLAAPGVDRTTMSISDVGFGYALFGESWLSRCRGLTLNDMPDTSYGRWVSDAHGEADADDDMLLEQVDVVIKWPRQEPRRHVYQRVILPLGQGAERRLLSASVLDSALPVDIELGHER